MWGGSADPKSADTSGSVQANNQLALAKQIVEEGEEPLPQARHARQLPWHLQFGHM